MKTYSNYCSYSINNRHLCLPQYTISVIFPWANECFRGFFFCNLKEKHLRRCLILSRVSFSPTVLCILMGALGIAARTGRIKTILEHSKSLRAATHGFFWPVLMPGKQIFRFPLEQNRSYFEGEKTPHQQQQQQQKKHWFIKMK